MLRGGVSSVNGEGTLGVWAEEETEGRWRVRIGTGNGQETGEEEVMRETKVRVGNGEEWKGYW